MHMKDKKHNIRAGTINIKNTIGPAPAPTAGPPEFKRFEPNKTANPTTPAQPVIIPKIKEISNRPLSDAIAFPDGM